MLIELHSHTSQHSQCSHIKPSTLVKKSIEKGIQALVITEHHYLWTDEEISDFLKKNEIYDNFLLFSAQEVNTNVGHVLVIGAKETIKEELSLIKLKESYPDAALILAHPFRNGRKPSKDDLLNPLLDAIEIFSSNHTLLENYLGLKLWHEYKFNAVSGSDTHHEDTCAIFPTLFDHPVRNLEELIFEIKNKRCRPFFKEIQKFGSTMAVEEITFGTKGTDDSRSRIIIKKPKNSDKWDSLKNSANINKEIYLNNFSNGKYRVPKIIEINEQEEMILEEGQRGKTLFDLLPIVSPSTGALYFKMTAKWIAKLHKANHKISSLDNTRNKENKRLKSYLKSFTSTNNPFTEKASKVIDFIDQNETLFFDSRSNHFVQVHGDYHPKNIIIGQDYSHDIETLFLSVIDFGSSFSFLPSYDVGYFISQFINQFINLPRILVQYTASDFIKYYMEEFEEVNSVNFVKEIYFFRIRANMSIASFLIKVGKGESDNLKWLINQSEMIMNNF
ncbi:MAG: hypothetical protein ACD_79C00291G0003 [uncultured bacterium]|nr:MAG: hypothetical protein ACD_79C00291G0003 [uncultured bacterium]